MKTGEKCFIIENNTHAKEVEIKGYSCGLYTVRTLPEGKTLRVRADRLFQTGNEAGQHLPHNMTKSVNYYGQLL